MIDVVYGARENRRQNFEIAEHVLTPQHTRRPLLVVLKSDFFLAISDKIIRNYTVCLQKCMYENAKLHVRYF